jgi:hypothetical protein
VSDDGPTLRHDQRRRPLLSRFALAVLFLVPLVTPIGDEPPKCAGWYFGYDVLSGAVSVFYSEISTLLMLAMCHDSRTGLIYVLINDIIDVASKYTSIEVVGSLDRASKDRGVCCARLVGAPQLIAHSDGSPPYAPPQQQRVDIEGVSGRSDRGRKDGPCVCHVRTGRRHHPLTSHRLEWAEEPLRLVRIGV